MLEDFRFAVRSLRKSPTFTAVALAVLALGIGAGTAVFSVVDAVVLRALPFDEHDRLVAVLEHDTTRPTTFGRGMTTPQMFLDWREQQEPFEAIAAVGGARFRLRNEQGEPAEARGQSVTADFFEVLRVRPLLGRTFTREDEIDGRHRVAILSHGFWQRSFGADPGVVGRTIELNEASWEIVGVLPRDFVYPVGSERPAEIFGPVRLLEEDKVRGGSRNYNWTAIARLKPGISVEQANDRMNALMASLDEQHPKWSPGRRARVITLHEHLVGGVRSWMLMLLAAVALVLLIACANVANLLLARATVRSREMGIRAALGASRWRLARALLVEGVVLSLAGAAIGVLLAYTAVQGIVAWLPPNLPRVADIGVDLRVLLTATGAALLTGIVFALAPSLQSSRPDLTTALKDGGRAATASPAGARLRSALVVAEVALAAVLLVGAGLFIRSFVTLMSVDVGLDYRNVLVLSVSQPMHDRDFDAAFTRGRAYAQAMLAAVSRVPGVVSAGFVSGGLPLTGSWSRTPLTLPGGRKFDGDDVIDRRTISPDYLKTLRIPVLRGRPFTDQDREGAPLVALVNEAAAQKYWPGEDVLGKRLILSEKEYTVVGVVGNIRHLGPEQPARQEVYTAAAQDRLLSATLVMRTAGDPLAVLPAVKTAIWSVNPEQRLSADTVTLEGHMDRLIAQRRFNMSLLSAFGALGLIIAAVGIYGVMAYIVAQRTNEIGVRMALGATRGHVLGMVLGRASVLMAGGLALGGAVAWGLSSRVVPFLFEVEGTDRLVFTGALVTLALAGLLASAVPARRAASVDPLQALRHE